MSLDPTVVQPIPTGADDATDVGNSVVAHLTRYNLADIAADHESRIAFGEKKYGQRLKIHNGRDAIMDSYQELLDFLSYAEQADLEGKKGFRSLFQRVAVIAEEVRGMLHASTEKVTHMKPTVTLIPNADAPFTTEERIAQRAELLNQDPENIVAIPFSELEGNLLHQVPSHLTVGETPVPVDIAGDALIEAPLEPEPVTELGEKLAAELDSFEPLTSSEIAVSDNIVGEGGGTPTLIDSEEKMDKLEKDATGEPLG